MENRRQTGVAYEQRAAQWLEQRGMHIVEKNFRCRQGEIDLIAVDGDYLVFVEVKYRKSSGSGHPAEAVDARKQRRILRVAEYYCWQKRIPEDHPCRFDVVCILGEDVEYIPNAFGY